MYQIDYLYMIELFSSTLIETIGKNGVYYSAKCDVIRIIFQYISLIYDNMIEEQLSQSTVINNKIIMIFLIIIDIIIIGSDDENIKLTNHTTHHMTQKIWNISFLDLFSAYHQFRMLIARKCTDSPTFVRGLFLRTYT